MSKKMENATTENKVKRSDFFETRTLVVGYKYAVLDPKTFQPLTTFDSTEKISTKKKEKEVLKELGMPDNAVIVETDRETKLYGIRTEELYMSVAEEIKED